MPEECKDQEGAAERAGDRYYAAMTAWLTQRKRSEEDRRRTFGLARAYNRALDLMIACLEHLKNRSNARRKLQHAQALQSHLQKEIGVLGASPQGLTSQTDEV